MTSTPLSPPLLARAADRRFGVVAGLATVAGVLLSGPIALAVVARVGPQPPWEGPERFVAHYHPIQALPYAFGFLLVVGSLMLVQAAASAADGRLRPRGRLAAALAGAFAGLILLNYIIQTTFVPSLVAHYRPELGPLLEALALACPRSLGWALEMWGYAVLGLATWLVAPVFAAGPLERWTARLYALNGAMSLAGGVMTAVRLDWVMSPAGLAMFAAWNLVMLALGGASVVVWRRRQLAGG